MSVDFIEIERLDNRGDFDKMKEIWDSYDENAKNQLVKHILMTSTVFDYNETTYKILGMRNPKKLEKLSSELLKCEIEDAPLISDDWPPKKAYPIEDENIKFNCEEWIKNGQPETYLFYRCMTRGGVYPAFTRGLLRNELNEPIIEVGFGEKDGPVTSSIDFFYPFTLSTSKDIPYKPFPPYFPQISPRFEESHCQKEIRRLQKEVDKLKSVISKIHGLKLVKEGDEEFHLIDEAITEGCSCWCEEGDEERTLELNDLTIEGIILSKINADD